MYLPWFRRQIKLKNEQKICKIHEFYRNCKACCTILQDTTFAKKWDDLINYAPPKQSNSLKCQVKLNWPIPYYFFFALALSVVQSELCRMKYSISPVCFINISLVCFTSIGVVCFTSISPVNYGPVYLTTVSPVCFINNSPVCFISISPVLPDKPYQEWAILGWDLFLCRFSRYEKSLKELIKILSSLERRRNKISGQF